MGWLDNTITSEPLEGPEAMTVQSLIFAPFGNFSLSSRSAGFARRIARPTMARPTGLPYQRRKSAHFGMSFAPTPQGSIGTLEVEFFGEPSMSLSL